MERLQLSILFDFFPSSIGCIKSCKVIYVVCKEWVDVNDENLFPINLKFVMNRWSIDEDYFSAFHNHFFLSPWLIDFFSPFFLFFLFECWAQNIVWMDVEEIGFGDDDNVGEKWKPHQSNVSRIFPFSIISDTQMYPFFVRDITTTKTTANHENFIHSQAHYLWMFCWSRKRILAHLNYCWCRCRMESSFFSPQLYVVYTHCVSQITHRKPLAHSCII